jgi:hypothetical protein
MEDNKNNANILKSTIPATVMMRVVVVLILLQLGYLAYMHMTLIEVINNQAKDADLTENSYMEGEDGDYMADEDNQYSVDPYYSYPVRNPNYPEYSNPTFSPENPLFEFALLSSGKDANYIKDSGEIVTAGNKTITVDFPAHDSKREASKVEITLDSVQLSQLPGNTGQQKIVTDVLISNLGPSDIYINYGSVVRYKVDGKWYLTNTYDDEDYMFEYSETAPYVYAYTSDQKYRFSANIPNDAKEITLVYSPATTE